MTILHLSDTHNRHRDLGDMPEADVLVHSGDFTMAGSDMEALDFLEWLCDLSFKHKIFIAGNHDDCMMDATLDGLPDNVHYLHDSGITIDGVSFYGVPMLAEFADGEMKLMEHYDLIPDNVDVLITHRPPLGILDRNDNLHFGSVALLNKVSVVKPRLHLFGHTHNARGLLQLHKTCYCNASICNDSYVMAYTPILMKL
jgi:Icc-related predicted phosphoesterase